MVSDTHSPLTVAPVVRELANRLRPANAFEWADLLKTEAGIARLAASLRENCPTLHQGILRALAVAPLCRVEEPSLPPTIGDAVVSFTKQKSELAIWARLALLVRGDTSVLPILRREFELEPDGLTRWCALALAVTDPPALDEIVQRLGTGITERDLRMARDSGKEHLLYDDLTKTLDVLGEIVAETCLGMLEKRIAQSATPVERDCWLRCRNRVRQRAAPR